MNKNNQNMNQHSHNMHTLIPIDAGIRAKHIDVNSLGFADNPQPRCPVALLLDTSSSMVGNPIRELNEGVTQFYRELSEDPVAANSVELTVITFGLGGVQHYRKFQPITQAASRPRPVLKSGGMTPMGGAINMGLREIKDRRKFYEHYGMAAFKPWMVILTDGAPNDEWEGPAARARKTAEKGQIVLLGVGVGKDVDMETLRSIDPGARRLRGLAFKEFFRWLSDSLKITSSSSTARQPNTTAATQHNHYDWEL